MCEFCTPQHSSLVLCRVYKKAFASSDFNLRFCLENPSLLLEQDWPIFPNLNTHFCLHCKFSLWYLFFFLDSLFGDEHTFAQQFTKWISVQSGVGYFLRAVKTKVNICLRLSQHWGMFGWNFVEHQTRGSFPLNDKWKLSILRVWSPRSFWWLSAVFITSLKTFPDKSKPNRRRSASAT